MLTVSYSNLQSFFPECTRIMAKKENVDEYGTHKKNEQRSAELYSENQRRSLKSQSCSLGYAR